MFLRLQLHHPLQLRVYSTLDLVERLYLNGHCFIGTIKTFKNLPSIIRKAEVAIRAPFDSERLDKGDWIYAMQENPLICGTAWHDSGMCLRFRVIVDP